MAHCGDYLFSNFNTFLIGFDPLEYLEEDDIYRCLQIKGCCFLFSSFPFYFLYPSKFVLLIYLVFFFFFFN